MRYGYYLPTRGPLSEPDAIGEMVGQGESMGFATIVIADHIVFPTEVSSPYPYTVDGGFPGQGDALEQLSLMSYVAALTTTSRLVTSVMILPHRNPVMTAKMLATIDVLSKGRVTVGVGVGWLREEFEALHAADFDKRGAVSNEYLEIFKKCWTEDPVAFEGEFYSFKELRCVPHPVQNPHPPIWIGGHSKPALRRAAKYADGWHPVGATAASPLPPPEFEKLMGELKALTEVEGRSFDELFISLKAPSYDPGVTPAGHARLPLSGEPDQVVEDIKAYQALGVEEVIFDFRAASYGETMSRMDQFMTKVAPQVG